MEAGIREADLISHACEGSPAPRTLAPAAEAGYLAGPFALVDGMVSSSSQPFYSFLSCSRQTCGANIKPMLFEPPHEELSDEEVVAVLRQSIAVAGRLSRNADLFLAGVCAEHLVDGLRAAGLLVIRPLRWELHR